MDQSLDGKILSEIKGVNYFRLENNNRTHICEGTLQICLLPEKDITYLKIDDFYYTLQKEIKFIAIQFSNYKTYLFPHIKSGFNALCVFQNENTISQLEVVLSNTVTLLDNQNLHFLSDQEKVLINTHCSNIFDTPLMTEDKTIYYIKKGGSLLKDAFSWVGEVTSKGVNIAGNYINSKLSSNKIEVSQETQQKYANIKNTTKSTFKVTGEFLQNVLNPVVQATNSYIDQLGQKIDNSDNDLLKKIKKIGGAAMDATSNAFDGLSEGAQKVGNTVEDNARNIAEKKLGEDATNTFLGNKQQNQQNQQN